MLGETYFENRTRAHRLRERMMLRNGFAIDTVCDSVAVGKLPGCVASLRNCIAKGPRDWFSVICDSDSVLVLSLSQLLRNPTTTTTSLDEAATPRASTSLSSVSIPQSTSTSTSTSSLSDRRSRIDKSSQANVPVVHRFVHDSDDVESQAWSRDGKLFVLACQRSLDIYDVNDGFRLVCSKRLYFIPTDVEIVRIRDRPLATSSSATTPNGLTAATTASTTTTTTTNSSTIDWNGYIVAVSGPDGLQLYNYNYDQQKFTVRITQLFNIESLMLSKQLTPAFRIRRSFCMNF